MIDVFIYVTGLALIQITGECAPSYRVFLPAGNFSSASVPGAHIHTHTLNAKFLAQTGGDIALLPGDITLKADSKDCGAETEVPPNLVDIASILDKGYPISAKCCGSKPFTECGPMLDKNAMRLVLEGDWTMYAAKACTREPEQLPSLPGKEQEKGFFQQAFNFMNTKKPWEVVFLNDDDLGHYGNTTLIRGQMPRVQLETLFGSSTALNRALYPQTTCNWLTGAAITGSECVIARISNLPKDTDTPPVDLGAADHHFAAYYDFLDTPGGTEFFLPLLAGGEMCPDSKGGGYPTGSCIGGIVAQPCAK